MVMDVGVQAWEPRGVPVGHMTEDPVNPSNLRAPGAVQEERPLIPY
jgi:hypothetical protein